MANFNTHISVAFVASGVTGLVIYKAGMLIAPEYLMCVVAGTIGGLLPDIDLEAFGKALRLADEIFPK